MARRRPWAGGLLFVGAAIFWLVNTAAEGAYPAYDIRDNALSRLGSVGSPTASYWNGAIFLLGACWLAGVLLALHGAVRRPWLVLNVVPPLCVFLVGLFPAGSIGALHNVGAFGVFVAGGVIPLVNARLFAGLFRVASAVLGATTLVCLLVFTFLPVADAIGNGGEERLVAYPILIWLMVAGGYVMAGGVLAERTERSAG